MLYTHTNQTKQVKLNAKQEKKYKNRLLAAGGGASTAHGLSSTLAFTPVQVSAAL